MEIGCSCASDLLHNLLNREYSVAGPNDNFVIPYSPDNGGEES